MLILIFYLNLASFFLVMLYGWKIGRQGSFFFCFMSNLISWFIILSEFYFVLSKPWNFAHLKLGVWFQSDLLLVHWGFLFDPLAIVMCFIVLTVSTLVQLYSYAYMNSDPSLSRFLGYISLFVCFMLILVSSDNFVVLFLGWEGVGLCSYLLISFWNTRVPALKSALKAMLVNRIGDFFLLTAMVLLFTEVGSLNFLVIFSIVPFLSGCTLTFFYMDFNFLTTFCNLLTLGAFGKSAQLGLHVWLPDAMEGPTPVSALIHAATMVTAGVFLVIRCSPVYEFAPDSLQLLVVIGSVTSIFAGLCGTVETDLKKIIAYSTCSQLGYMFFICGLSGYGVGLFHLFNHAFFKALLFLSAGTIIHSVSNEQNITRMGGLAKILPFTFAMMQIGLLSLNAAPFTAGFYSKELILATSFASFGSLGAFSFFLGSLTSGLTAFYSYRLFFYVFISETNLNRKVVLSFSQENFFLTLPLLLLAFLSLTSGFLFKEVFTGLGSNFFNFSIFVSPENLKIYDSEFLPNYIKLIPLLCSAVGWGCLNPYSSDVFLKFRLPNIYNLFKNEWFFNRVYNTKLSSFYFNGFFNFFLAVDAGLLQFFGPKGIFYSIYNLSTSVSRLHSGFIHNYLCIIMLNFSLLLFVSSVQN